MRKELYSLAFWSNPLYSFDANCSIAQLHTLHFDGSLIERQSTGIVIMAKTTYCHCRK